MEDPILLITSSEEGGGGGDGSQEKRRMRVRSKLDEYRMISDLSGFENLKAMIETEALMRRKKKNRTTKRRKIDFYGDEYRIISDLSGFENLKAMIDAEALMRRRKKKRKVEFYSQEDVTIDAANEKEDAGVTEAVEATKGIGADDGVNSSVVIDLCSSSLEADRAISDVSFCRGVKNTEPARAVVGVRKKRRRRKRTKRIPAKDKLDDAKEEDDAKDNIVLRMLLRKPRYFDPPCCNWVTCSNCGKENHSAANCKAQKWKKPCFLCGSFKHIWKYCRQGQDCFIQKGRDYCADDCPGTNQGNNARSNICLRCGDSGHDMFSCRGDYSTDDLREIQCYVCRSFGHLCCVEAPDPAPRQISCYNCGQSGHLGSECTNSCEAPCGINSSVLCYKCGKEGHFARRCGGNVKDRLRISDILQTAKRLPSKTINHAESSSGTHNFCKAEGRDRIQYKNQL